MYYTWKYRKSNTYKNNKFKTSGPKNLVMIYSKKWSEKLELPDGSYSVSDIPDYFKYIIK